MSSALQLTPNVKLLLVTLLVRIDPKDKGTKSFETSTQNSTLEELIFQLNSVYTLILYIRSPFQYYPATFA